jgi:hypothetical protein
VKVGDLVRRQHTAYTGWTEDGDLGIGIIIRPNGKCGVMILWEHGQICYSPLSELEVIGEV